MTFFKRKKKYKLSWNAGDTEYLQIKYLKMDKITPMDFTDATLTMQLRRSLSAADASATITGTVEESTGVITFTATPAQTRALATSLYTRYVFDVQFSNTTRTKTLMCGMIQVSTDITR